MKITFCGDVSPVMTSDLFAQNAKEELFNDVLPVFAKSDRIIVNLECALTDSDGAIKKIGPNLKCTPKVAQVLKEIGVTDCGLSNNHVFDYGVQGALDTLKAVREAGLNHTGFGENYQDSRKNLIVEQDGKKIAVIAVCEHEYCYALENRMGARPFLPYDTIMDIRKAKEENDFVVVMYHGGKEQSVYPSPRLRRQSQALVEHGADVVLCQHSHCVGCYEEFQGGHILYGQGNFHFVSRSKHPHWQNGLMVHAYFDDKVTLEFDPVVVKGNGIAMADEQQKKEILDGLWERSDNLHNGKWLEGWREFCSSMDWYHEAIKKAYADGATEDDNELFAHYLFCEAHHDVWEELCKLSWETRETP